MTRGDTGSKSTLNITAQIIGGIIGNTPNEEVAQSMRISGSIEIPNPTYGYLRAIQLGREMIGRNLYNAWMVEIYKG